MAANGPVVRVENLTHAYGDRVALDGLTLAVEPGEIFGILGPNGSGKTTLFRILSTLIPTAPGHAFVLGRDEAPRLPQLHRKTQFFADSAALARLTSRPEWREVVIHTTIERAEQARRGIKTGLYDDTVSTATVEAVLKLLRARVDAGAAGVLVTHEARHAAWADRVVFLRDGELVDTAGPVGRPEDLLAGTA